MITITEAANRLGIPARTLRHWCRQGRVPGAKMVGPIWLVPIGAQIDRSKMGRPRKS